MSGTGLRKAGSGRGKESCVAADTCRTLKPETETSAVCFVLMMSMAFCNAPSQATGRREDTVFASPGASLTSSVVT